MPPIGGKRTVQVKQEVEVKHEPISEDYAASSPINEMDRRKVLWDTAVTGTPSSRFDLLLVCGAPGRQEEVWTHQSILAAASQTFASLLQGRAVQMRDGSWTTTTAIIFLPEVKSGDMIRLLCLLYNGFAQVTNAEQAKELKDLTKDLGLTIVKLNKKDNKISIVPGSRALARENLAGRHFLSSININKTSHVSLEEDVVGKTEKEDEDPDDPPPVEPSRTSRGPASKRRTYQHPGSPDKRMRVDPLITNRVVSNINSTVEEVHTCSICLGKTKEGKTDREANNLSFKSTGIKRLLDHYSKHLYDEGLIQQQVPWGDDNTDPETEHVKDEYGLDFRYSCKITGCWMAKKPAVGYKAFALHNATDHGALEMVLSTDTRPVLVSLLTRIKKFRAEEVETNKPRPCIILGCKDNDKLHTNAADWASLKKHYISHHFLSWFSREPGPDEEGPRTQEVASGARVSVCTLCRAKVPGDSTAMAEHYGTIHDRLSRALKEDDGAQARMVLKQMFPQYI